MDEEEVGAARDMHHGVVDQLAETQHGRVSPHAPETKQRPEDCGFSFTHKKNGHRMWWPGRMESNHHTQDQSLLH